MRIDISLLPALAAAFLLAFGRIGAMVMLMPGLGEANIPVRIKLSIALLLTLIMLPLHRADYHVDMQSITSLLVVMLQEIMIGIVLVGVMVDRPTLTLRTLTVAALGVLLLAPESVVHPSFQMSFAATLALIAAYERGLPWMVAGADTSMGARVALWGGREVVAQRSAVSSSA